MRVVFFFFLCRNAQMHNFFRVTFCRTSKSSNFQNLKKIFKTLRKWQVSVEIISFLRFGEFDTLASFHATAKRIGACRRLVNKFQSPSRVFCLVSRHGGRGRAIVINSVSRVPLIFIWPANRDVPRVADTTRVPGKRSIYIERITQYRRRPIPQGRDPRPLSRTYFLYFFFPLHLARSHFFDRSVECVARI